MKKICFAILLMINCIVCGYGQFTSKDKIVLLKVEDTDDVLNRSGESMLKSAMMTAFLILPNSDVFDLSGYSPKQGTTFRLSEITEIGKRASADMVIVPSVAKLEGSEIFLSAKVVNVKTGITVVEDDVKFNLRAEGTTQASVLKQNCENLAKKLSNKILNNQMKTIAFVKGKLYRNGIELSESEINSFFDGNGSDRYSRYEEWKQAENRLIRGQKCMIAGAVLTSIGLAITATGTVGMMATRGWGAEDTYRALSIAGVSVGSVSTFVGLMCFTKSKSKKAGWKEMEDVFLEKQNIGYRAELNFGNQRNGVGFELRF